MYRSEMPCFNDDMQSLGAAVLAGVLATLPKTGELIEDLKFVLSGICAIPLDTRKNALYNLHLLLGKLFAC